YDIGADVRLSDQYFDATRFMEDLSVTGSIDKKIADLILEVQRAGTTHPYRPPAKHDPPPRGAGDVTSEKMFEGLLSGVGENLTTVVAVVNPPLGFFLGWLLSAYAKASADLPGNEVADALNQLGAQVTKLQGQVAQAKLELLVSPTLTIIGKVKEANERLAWVATRPKEDTTRAKLAQDALNYIGQNLRDAPAILNERLASTVPVADGANIIKAASQAVVKRNRFFDSNSSATIRSVYDYYAKVQTELAVLLTNYENSDPDTFSKETKEKDIKRIQGQI